MADVAYLKSPHSGEVKEVEATIDRLTPYLAAGWYQVLASTEQKPATPVEEEEPRG